jgi:hypothetical protein
MPDSKVLATLCLSGQFNLRTLQGENKRERTRIGRLRQVPEVFLAGSNNSFDVAIPYPANHKNTA